MNKASGSMVPGQTITLTYNGGGKTRRDNQAVMCKESGRSKCRKDGTSGADGSMNPYSNFLAGEGLLDVWYLKLDCDEFPFASSCEGGSLSAGSTSCVIAWQNNIGATKMSRQLGLGRRTKTGERFVVKVDSRWDCSSQRLVTRSDTSEETSRMQRKPKMKKMIKRDDIVVRNFTGGTSAMTLYLGDMEAGEFVYPKTDFVSEIRMPADTISSSYHLNMSIQQGTFSQAIIVNEDGEAYHEGNPELAPSPHGNTSYIIPYTLTEQLAGARLIALTGDTDVNVQYKVSTGNRSIASQESDAMTLDGHSFVKLTMLFMLAIVVMCEW